MNRYTKVGTVLYHKHLSNIEVVEVSEDRIKAFTSVRGVLDFPFYDFGKVLFFKKDHSNLRFESYHLYLEFYNEENTKILIEEEKIKKLLEEEKIKEERDKRINLINKDHLNNSENLSTWVDFSSLKMNNGSFKFLHNDLSDNSIPNKFILHKNNYLEIDVTGYFHQYYTGYKKPGNPDFVNTLKNTFNDISQYNLIEARDKVLDILNKDIKSILEDLRITNCLCVCVPRAKALETYTNSQLMFKEAVSIASNSILGVIDGTDCIVRYKNTLTTHLQYSFSREQNDGEKPYPGITLDTCRIDKQKINNQNIILIDDIYTNSINIDEDCIQALFDNGAKNIILYSIGYTRRS